MKLSNSGKLEYEEMRRQVLAYPDDEATPSSRMDTLPKAEKEYIIDEYFRLGGK